MPGLSEENIKKSTLKLLKKYYKFLPHKGKMVTGLDIVTEEGLIIDGYIKYDIENDKQFLVAFEATSYDSSSELNFKRLGDQLRWDALAASFALGALILGVFHWYGFYPVLEFRLVPALVIGAFVSYLVFIFYQLVFERISISRYRYIYAIEQFRRYDADEQWISYGEDVFPDKEDVYYKELKRQCLKYGIGLIEVDRYFVSRIILRAAKAGTVNHPRAPIDFMRVKIKTTGVEVSKNAGRVWRALLSIRKSKDILRYQKLPLNQIIVIVFSVLLMINILILQYLKRPIKYENKEEYFSQIKADGKAEDDYVDIDTPMELGEFDLDLPEEEREKVFKNYRNPKTNVIMLDKTNNKLIFYDCSRMSNIKEKTYIIEDKQVKTLEAAVNRINFLRKMGLSSNAISKSCFIGFAERGYVVYHEEIYTDSLKADAEALFVKTFARSQDIETEASVRSIHLR